MPQPEPDCDLCGTVGLLPCGESLKRCASESIALLACSQTFIQGLTRPSSVTCPATARAFEACRSRTIARQ